MIGFKPRIISFFSTLPPRSHIIPGFAPADFSLCFCLGESPSNRRRLIVYSKMRVALLFSALAAFLCHVSAENPEDYTKANSVYDFSVEDIQGNKVSLDKYKGKVLLIVNVASNCGLTEKNYQQLNELYEKYESKGLRILAFPCNQFSEQEPGTNQEIAQFAQKHGVKFDMFSKIEVNGDNAHPLYKYLKYKQPGTNANDSAIEWNFTKFIVDKNGEVVERHMPKKDPLDLISSIEKYF